MKSPQGYNSIMTSEATVSRVINNKSWENTTDSCFVLFYTHIWIRLFYCLWRTKGISYALNIYFKWMYFRQNTLWLSSYATECVCLFIVQVTIKYQSVYYQPIYHLFINDIQVLNSLNFRIILIWYVFTLKMKWGIKSKEHCRLNFIIWIS